MGKPGMGSSDPHFITRYVLYTAQYVGNRSEMNEDSAETSQIGTNFAAPKAVVTDRSAKG